MNLKPYLLPALLCIAFLAGLAMHLLFYAPTEKLPAKWRNLARYLIGVLPVLALAATEAIALPTTLPIYIVFATFALFALFGLGVLLGYTVEEVENHK